MFTRYLLRYSHKNLKHEKPTLHVSPGTFLAGMSDLFFTYFLSFSESKEGSQHPPITVDVVTFLWLICPTKYEGSLAVPPFVPRTYTRHAAHGARSTNHFTALLLERSEFLIALCRKKKTDRLSGCPDVRLILVLVWKNCLGFSVGYQRAPGWF